VPLESTLDNGDVVEIFTSKAENAGPSRDWMSFVKSPRARNKIRQWFARERREDAIEEGKDSISRMMRKQGLPLQRLFGGDALVTLAKDLRFSDVSSLYAAVGEGHLSAQTVVQRLVQALGGPEGAVEDIAETAVPTRARPRMRPTGDPGVVVKGAHDVWAKLARCCTPVPNDEILGFVTRAGAARRRGVGAQRGFGVPRRDPGRGAGPHAPPVRRHARALRRARQHPVRVGDDDARPRRGVPVHLRDG
jgi:GTP pyrophosphokinase